MCRNGCAYLSYGVSERFGLALSHGSLSWLKPCRIGASVPVGSSSLLRFESTSTWYARGTHSNSCAMAQGFERRVTMFEPFDDERFNDVNKVHPLTLGRAVLPPTAVLSHSRPC